MSQGERNGRRLPRDDGLRFEQLDLGADCSQTCGEDLLQLLLIACRVARISGGRVASDELGGKRRQLVATVADAGYEPLLTLRHVAHR